MHAGCEGGSGFVGQPGYVNNLECGDRGSGKNSSATFGNASGFELLGNFGSEVVAFEEFSFMKR